MPLHKLTTEFRKIASVGETAAIFNSGLADVVLTRGGGRTTLPPGGSAMFSELRSDVFARSEGAKAEVTTTLAPGLPRDV